MGKISPVSIKYMIHANFTAEGALEKPDVIGAIFGQTEGLLGSELEMRELQKEGKIGRIEVNLERQGKRTTGVIKIPTALDQSETTLIAAAIETIERIGPSDSQIEVEKIEDVRGSKREYIIERAKKLIKDFQGTSSREISDKIKTAARISSISEYGEEKLPCGDLSGNEIIVVEGRADVLNLVRNGVNNVIAMNGTKLPEEIRELSKEKDVTLFVDGDRGGKLIVQNVVDNANVKYIATAPSGKEVEELTGKEILISLRKKISVEEFLSKGGLRKRSSSFSFLEAGNKVDKEKIKEFTKKYEGTGKAVLLDDSLKEIKRVSIKGLVNSLKRNVAKNPKIIVIDGTVTNSVIKTAEQCRCKVIVGKNFATTDTDIQLLSF
jgi:DNA primase